MAVVKVADLLGEPPSIEPLPVLSAAERIIVLELADGGLLRSKGGNPEALFGFLCGIPKRNLGCISLTGEILGSIMVRTRGAGSGPAPNPRRVFRETQGRHHPRRLPDAQGGGGQLQASASG